ncbi:recombinase family protein [Veillonella sp.]|uniref:recombinase family protein n=1 Tax=Veillonella sp. TaxID=1926307 RepID=UPI0025DEE4E2|nr:recombinase family protein [Veillonella sp.]
MQKAKRAGLYIRVSKEEQALHGYSLDAQENKLKEYAKSKGYKIIDIYRDEGITARKKPARRAEFMRMINDVKDNRLDCILFIKLDRWFRNVSDYYTYQAILDQHNVTWETTEEEYNTNTAQGRLYLNIKLSIAQNESDTTAERIKFVFEEKKKRREAISGQNGLGYKIVNKHLVKNEDAPIVVDIFEAYIKLQSIRKVMSFVNAKYNKNYTFRRIRNVLSQKKYTGEKYGISDYCEPIIDIDTYNTVQKILSKNIKWTPSGRSYIFVSLIHCPCCGNILTGAYSHNIKYRNNHYYYYRCPNHQKNHNCPFYAIPENIVERELLKIIKPSIESFIIENISLNSTDNKNQITKSTIQAKLKRLKELYIEGFIDRKEYDLDYNKLQSQLQAISPKKSSKNLDKLKSLLDIDIANMYFELDRNHKQQFWHAICKEVKISTDKRVLNIIFK